LNIVGRFGWKPGESTGDPGVFTKDERHVTYPPNFNLLDKSFELTGVICHSGGYGAGHYVALQRVGKV